MERAANTEIWIAAGGYLLALAAIGGWAWRRTRNERDFFIAGQRGGLWAIGLATMAASFSSFVFLGGPGLMARAQDSEPCSSCCRSVSPPGCCAVWSAGACGSCPARG